MLPQLLSVFLPAQQKIGNKIAFMDETRSNKRNKTDGDLTDQHIMYDVDVHYQIRQRRI
jgi:hypothetical protein